MDYPQRTVAHCQPRKQDQHQAGAMDKSVLPLIAGHDKKIAQQGGPGGSDCPSPAMRAGRAWSSIPQLAFRALDSRSRPRPSGRDHTARARPTREPQACGRGLGAGVTRRAAAPGRPAPTAAGPSTLTGSLRTRANRTPAQVPSGPGWRRSPSWRTVCVDPRLLDSSFAGRRYDERLLADLPTGVDPCGENGEFHTFVHGGPIFAESIACETGEIVERDGFVFCDLAPARKG